MGRRAHPLPPATRYLARLNHLLHSRTYEVKSSLPQVPEPTFVDAREYPSQRYLAEQAEPLSIGEPPGYAIDVPTSEQQQIRAESPSTSPQDVVLSSYQCK